MATLEALRPDYLTARFDRDDARDAARSARGRADAMITRNDRHATEVARAERVSYGQPFVTNAYALAIGSGSGLTVIYSRCRHDDPHDCDHDARSSPWSDKQIDAAYQAADDAAQYAVAAADRFGDLEESASFDVADAARDAGARFCWWPSSRFVDPRRYQYRGQPITSAELDDLGPFELRRLLNDGGVVEVAG